MRIPKYVEEAINRRTRAAIAWINADTLISNFIHKNGLEDVIDTADYAGGVEGIMNPEESGERIKQAIYCHNNQRKSQNETIN